MHQVKLFFLILLINFVYSSVAFNTLIFQTNVRTTNLDLSKFAKENLILRYYVNGESGVSPPSKTTYKTAINQWLPAIMVAGVLAISIIAIVYAIGKAFNVDKLKTYASSEIPQVIATLFFSLIIVAILELGSNVLISFEDSILPQASLQAVCDNIASAHNSLSFINPSNTAAYGLDAIYGIAYSSANPAICEIIKNREGNEPYYFLASSEIILLNNTARLVNFSNSLYVLHTTLSFLQKLENEIEVVPIADISFSPFAGLDPLASAVKGIEQDIIGYISFNFISIMLLLFVYNYWVVLLMVGIFLRTFSFTRKLGGFLIAFVISTIFITPLTYLLTYQVLTTQVKTTTGQSQPLFPPVSMNPESSIQPVCSISSATSASCNTCLIESYSESICSQTVTCPSSCPTPQCVFSNGKFCVECVGTTSTSSTSTAPSTSTSTASLTYQGFCGCFWEPYTSPVILWELKEFFGNLLTPILALPTTQLTGYACNLDTATAYVTWLGSSEFIGRMAIETYLFPLISFFVTLANILGLSWLFGGTTRIYGLEKLVG